MSKIDKNKKKIIAIISGIILIAIIIFLLWFFNRKFDVTFDLNNGTKEEIIKVKYLQTINEKDVKDQKDLGESFIAWYEVIGVKEKEDVLAKEPFDFNTKITKNLKLKALYEGKIETITITFDSKGGSAVSPITINKGTALTLPKNPKYKGYYCGNKTTVLDYKSGITKKVPKDKWLIYKDNEKIPPIVEEELWNRVNSELEKKQIGYRNKQRLVVRSNYAYSGKLICKEHNIAYTRSGIKKGRMNDYRYWSCRLYKRFKGIIN